MSLDSTLVSEIRAVFAASPLATTVAVAIKSGGTFGSPQSITACVSSYKRSQGFGTPQREQRIIEAILVRPMTDPTGTVKLGDKVTYNSEAYFIVEIDNTAIKGWICERSERLAIARDESFRAEGGGT